MQASKEKKSEKRDWAITVEQGEELQPLIFPFHLSLFTLLHMQVFLEKNHTLAFEATFKDISIIFPPFTILQFKPHLFTISYGRILQTYAQSECVRMYRCSFASMTIYYAINHVLGIGPGLPGQLTTYTTYHSIPRLSFPKQRTRYYMTMIYNVTASTVHGV